MSKSLVEQIREMIDVSIDREWHPTSCSDGIIGRSVISKDDERELFTVIADRIEREYMPLPMLEGEPLRVGDKVDCHSGEQAEIAAVVNSRVVVVRYTDKPCPLMLWDVCELERHLQDVMDADGVPINVGDVVYFVDDAFPFDVLGVGHDGYDETVHIGRKDGTSTEAWVSPGDLTHKQPDTLERIEEDAKKEHDKYWGCTYVLCLDCPAAVDGRRPWERYATDGSCEKAKTLDLLFRQREVLERGKA